MIIAAILSSKGSDVASVPSGLPMRDAVALLSERRIGALPVLGDGTILGMFSERDLVHCLAKHGPEALDWPVDRAMSSPAVTVEMETPILAALAILLIVPIVGAIAEGQDAPRDQRVFVGDTFFDQSDLEAPPVCEDPATDVVSFSMRSYTDVVEARLGVNDLSAPRPTCDGKAIGNFVRVIYLYGWIGGDRDFTFAYQSDFGEHHSICVLPRGNGQCSFTDATFRVDGDELIWQFAPARPTSDWTYDLRGMNFDLHAGGITHIPAEDAVIVRVEPIRVQDDGAPVFGTI